MQALGKESRPFGATIHTDHQTIENGSEASRAARYRLNIHDEATTTVLDAVHKIDDASAPPVQKTRSNNSTLGSLSPIPIFGYVSGLIIIST